VTSSIELEKKPSDTIAEPQVSGDLFFTEKCKEIAREVSLPSARPEISSEEAKAIEKIVQDASKDVSKQSHIDTLPSFEEISSKRDEVYENITSEVKEKFGIGAVSQEVEAKSRAWVKENINDVLEAEARLRTDKEKNQDQDNKNNKTIIDLIIDKVLELLGLEDKKGSTPTKKKPGEKKEKEEKEEKDGKGLKSKKENWLIKFLKATGLLE